MQRNSLNNKTEEYLFGRNFLLEALKTERVFTRIILEKSLGYSKDTRIHAIIERAQANHIPVSFVAKDAIQKIENDEDAQSGGVIGIAQIREELSVKEVLAHCKTIPKEPFFLLINNILYEENLGAILRSAAAGGVDGLIVPKREKRLVNAQIQRSSMGGSEYVPLIRESLFSAIDTLKEEGIKIIGVELTGENYYFDTDLTGPIALVLGGEHAGVSTPLQKRCDEIVKIPMVRPIQSLNVSVSTAILIYEKIRQECQN